MASANRGWSCAQWHLHLCDLKQGNSLSWLLARFKPDFLMSSADQSQDFMGSPQGLWCVLACWMALQAAACWIHPQGPKLLIYLLFRLVVLELASELTRYGVLTLLLSSSGLNSRFKTMLASSGLLHLLTIQKAGRKCSVTFFEGMTTHGWM